MTLFTLWIWLFSFITHRFIQTRSWKWASVGKCTTWCTMHKIWEHIKGHIMHFMCHVFRPGLISNMKPTTSEMGFTDRFAHNVYNLWTVSLTKHQKATFFSLAVTSTNEPWDPRSWDCHPHPQAPGCHLSRQYRLYCPCSPATQEERKRC